MPDPALDVDDHLTGIELIPAPVQILRNRSKLDNQIPREVLRLDLTAFLPPQPHQGNFIIAHDDPSVGAADEGAPVHHMVFSLLSSSSRADVQYVLCIKHII